MLGPSHRFARVLEAAELERTCLTTPVSSPAGLDIGGELPESIALSIVSECHAVLQGKQVIEQSSLQTQTISVSAHSA